MLDVVAISSDDSDWCEFTFNWYEALWFKVNQESSNHRDANDEEDDGD